MPTSSCNGLELTLPRNLQSTLEEQVCLIATVRLVTPQFLKVRTDRIYTMYTSVTAACVWHQLVGHMPDVHVRLLNYVNIVKSYVELEQVQIILFIKALRLVISRPERLDLLDKFQSLTNYILQNVTDTDYADLPDGTTVTMISGPYGGEYV